MARVKRGVTSHAKHKKTLKAAKGFYGRRKNTIRTAKAAVDKAMQYATRDRKNKNRTIRALWIQRRPRCNRMSRHPAWLPPCLSFASRDGREGQSDQNAVTS